MKQSNDTNKERWVTCLVCGKKVQKAYLSISDSTCSCGTKFTVCATKDFVTTIMHEKGDNLSMQERIEKYVEQLTKVTS